MAFKFSISLIGNDKLKHYFSYAKTNCIDLTIPLKKFAVHMYASIADRFQTETTPEGIKWQRLSEKYLNSKIKKRHQRILRISGLMWRSIISKSGEKGESSKFGHSLTEIGKNFIRLGTNIIYAAVHQFGYKKIPKRTFLGFTKTDITVAENYILERLI